MQDRKRKDQEEADRKGYTRTHFGPDEPSPIVFETIKRAHQKEIAETVTAQHEDRVRTEALIKKVNLADAQHAN